MGSWERALDAAGVRDARLRADYGRLRRQVTDYRREAALAARLLLPPALVPHVIAATAFMHRTDSLLDGGGAVAERKAAFAAWEAEVAEALAAGATDNPELRPLLHTVAAHPVLADRAREFLATATTDLDFTGFATEADYQRYLDDYSLPAFMVVATLLGPAGDQSAYRAACRTYIDGSQRLDFVNDLAEDLADGRLTLADRYLTEHQVARGDLEQGRAGAAVRALITDQLDRADRTLAEGWAVIDLVPPAQRPMVRCMLRLDELTSAAARADIPALLRRSAGPGKAAALRLLAGEYLRARRLRG